MKRAVKMVKSRDFKIFSAQISIFTPELNFSLNNIHIDLGSKHSSILDGDPVLLPLPNEAPFEIPRLIMSSVDQKLKLEIAKSRLNFFRFRKEDIEDISIESFLAAGLRIINDYMECTSARVGRIAVVKRLFAENDNPGLTLASHFCKDEWMKQPFNRPENFEIHAHKKYPLPKNKLNINSWVRCKTGQLKNIDEPIILVEQDINTLAEDLDKNDFDMKFISNFCDEVFVEQKDILNKYFPNNG